MSRQVCGICYCTYGDDGKCGCAEPVAIRHSFDGYGWLYTDNGSGSNWYEVGMKHQGAEPLYTAPQRSEELNSCPYCGGDKGHFEGCKAPHARDAITWTPDTGYVFPIPAPQSVNQQLLEALKEADKALRWIETAPATRAWDRVRAAIAAAEGEYK